MKSELVSVSSLTGDKSVIRLDFFKKTQSRPYLEFLRPLPETQIFFFLGDTAESILRVPSSRVLSSYNLVQCVCVCVCVCFTSLSTIYQLYHDG